MDRRTQGALAIAMLLGLLPAAARAGDWTDKIKFSGYASSDIRYDLDTWRGALGDGRHFELNRNDFDLKLKIEADERVQAVVETRFRFNGFNHATDLSDLSDSFKVDPWELRLVEAYLEVHGLIWDQLDLKIGRMVQNWGAADMFNPTDNLSGRDFSDPLDYGVKVPNQMLEINMYPTDWLQLTAVWVPVFKPSMLPSSTGFAFAVGYDQDGCFDTAPIPPLDVTPRAGQTQSDAQTLQDLFQKMVPQSPAGSGKHCNLVFPKTQVVMVEPALSFANSQAAARARFRAGDFDIALSYYYGRFSFPVAYTAVADVVSPQPKASKITGFPTDSTTLVPGKYNVKYVAEVMYPRMHVAGLDFSYSMSWFYDVGLVGELAVIFPEEVDFGLTAFLDGATVGGFPMRSVNVPSTPFVKATIGLDYTFTKWLYANAMYVRGFFDEFNDKYGIHNYFVLTAELKFLDDQLQIRGSTALNCDDLSATLYPQITWIPAPSVELQLGMMWFFGSTVAGDPGDYASKSKFGQKAVGRDFAFFKTKVSW